MLCPSPSLSRGLPYEQELRWRGQATARALVNIAAAARTADAAAAARLERMEKTVWAKVDAQASAAAASSARLTVQLAAAGRTIESVESRVAAATAAAAEHERAEASRFQVMAGGSSSFRTRSPNSLEHVYHLCTIIEGFINMSYGSLEYVMRFSA